MNRSINLPIRDRTIDNIRGFAIFLVVVGHCIMRFYETDAAFINNYWFRLIYLFIPHAAFHVCRRLGSLVDF